MLAFQLLGGWDGINTYEFPTLFENFWAGGALMTFPGFVAGLLAQFTFRRESISDGRITVLLLGAISAVLSLAALAYINGVIGAF